MRTAFGNLVSNLVLQRLAFGLLATAMVFGDRPALADRSEAKEVERDDDDDRSGERDRDEDRRGDRDRDDDDKRSDDNAPSSGSGVPNFDDVKKYVEAVLAAKPGYQKGDVLTQGDVSAIVARLEQAGLKVREKQAGFNPVKSDSHPFGMLLKTKEGVKFVRDLKNSHVLTRMGRLAEFPEGMNLVQQIVSSNDQVTAALLDDQKVCQQMEERYSDKPSMKNFSALSDDVYDADQFIEHLQTLHKMSVGSQSRPSDR